MQQRATGRVLLGILAGTAATVAMTAAMRRMHRQLPARERYPLPPREITERVSRFVASDLERPQEATLSNHFAFGAAAGAFYAVLFKGRSLAAGAIYGLTVWATSYLGWIPATDILANPRTHPPRRNLLMLTAHLVWGAVLTASLHELERAQPEIFSGRGAQRDIPGSPDQPKRISG